jgi:hypothetical protein
MGVQSFQKAAIAVSDKETSSDVRQLALQTMWILARLYPSHTVAFNSGQPVSLVDDVFSKLCVNATDINVQVRTASCGLLGILHGVKQDRLLQTFSKKPIMMDAEPVIMLYATSLSFELSFRSNLTCCVK